MIDIYRDALLNGASNANNLVNAAVNAINQNGGGGSYAPYAAGTPTLGARELAETTRNNSMENQYKQSALKESARNNDLQNQTQMAQIAETRRGNDLQNTYQMGSLANAQTELNYKTQDYDRQQQLLDSQAQAWLSTYGGHFKSSKDAIAQIYRNINAGTMDPTVASAVIAKIME